MKTARHRTAIHRRDASRPVRIALEDGILTSKSTFFDYGCGHGADILVLRKLGLDAEGWDPAHRAHEPRRGAEIINLGFVVNVIESAPERYDVLRKAWGLAETVLIVAARLRSDQPDADFHEFEDGCLTSTGTFQKFFTQTELRDWIEAVLDVQPIAAAPGVFYVFRSAPDRVRFLHKRQRQRRIIPSVFKNEVLFEEHRALLEPLMAFWRERGRLPAKEEWADYPEVRDVFGSLRKGFQVIVSTTDTAVWDNIRRDRQNDLLVYLALAKFGKRPRRGELPMEMWYDVKDFWGKYRVACDLADALLFSMGDGELLNVALSSATVGRVTERAVYVHVDEVANLAPILRIYEGAARSYIGAVEEANVVKLHRTKPAVTYMVYSDFAKDAYPRLRYSLRVELHSFRVKERFFDQWESPPILHEKGRLLGLEHPLRRRADKLSRAETRLGLDAWRQSASDTQSWQAVLDEAGLVVHGHQLRASRRQFA